MLQAQAAHAVNLALTSRNWLMGCYIVEFEQSGEDRAAYGEQLLKKLEQRLKTKENQLFSVITRLRYLNRDKTSKQWQS